MSLGKSHKKALNKIGDIYCPGVQNLPSFSQLGCVEHADRLVAELPAQDLKDLKLLLLIFSFLPAAFLKSFFWLLETRISWPGVIGTNLRKIRFGLRGLSFALYYSGLHGADYQGPTPPDIIGYEVSVPLT